MSGRNVFTDSKFKITNSKLSGYELHVFDFRQADFASTEVGKAGAYFGM